MHGLKIIINVITVIFVITIIPIGLFLPAVHIFVVCLISMSLNLYFITNDHSLIISLVVWQTIFLVVLFVFNDLYVGW